VPVTSTGATFNPTHQAELTNEPTPELLEPRPTPELQEVPDAKVLVAPPAPPVVAPVKVPSPKKGPSPRRVATPRKVATPRRVATPKRAASPVKAPVVTPVEPVNLKVESLGITWRCGKLGVGKDPVHLFMVVGCMDCALTPGTLARSRCVTWGWFGELELSRGISWQRRGYIYNVNMG